MADRSPDAVLARRRAHRERIVLDAEAAERLQNARAALGFPNDTTTKESS